jgi:hypothetical protein
MPTDTQGTPRFRVRLLLAAVTGAVAGAVRAGLAWIFEHVDWILNHLAP